MGKGGGGIGRVLNTVSTVANPGTALVRTLTGTNSVNPRSIGQGIGNFVGDITGSNRAAEAAQAAAMAQAAEAARQRQALLDQGNKNQREAMALAEATPQELAALNRSYAAADKSLAREQKLLDAIDPALMEASKQALSLLRGESADVNKPMNDMRAMQRQQLVNSLRAQYGPGAESTSIGSKLLQQFDMESNMATAQNQRNALGQVFGIASSDLGSRLTRGIGQVQQVGQGFSALQERKLNTQLNTGNSLMAALSGTQAQMIQSAGAPYVGEALRAQAQQGLFNQAIGLASMYGGNYMGAMGAAKGAAAGGASPNAAFGYPGGSVPIP